MLRHDLAFPPDPERLALSAGLFAALAEPTRLTLLLALREGEQAVGDLVEVLAKPQSTVSRHLAVLRAADLVRTRRDAQRVLYRIASVHVADLLEQAMSHCDHVLGAIPHDHGHAS